MASDSRPVVTPNLIVGLLVTCVGVALALDQLQLVDARLLFRFWPVAVILFGASMVLNSLQGGDYIEPGRRPRPGAGRVFLLLLIMIAVTQSFHRDREAKSSASSERVNLIAVMGQDQRVNASTRFRGGEMTSVMGACRLDLRQATLPPGEEAVIEVFALMGGVIIQVPEGWTLDVQVVPVLGGVEDRRGKPDPPDRRNRRNRTNAEAEQESATDKQQDASRGTAAPGPETQTPAELPTPGGAPASNATQGAAPRLVLRGLVTMGGLTIRS
jgi:hypothetical protein